MTRRRVVVTGLGLVSPVGSTVADGWANIVAGHSGIDKITRFDASGLACRIAGEVKGFNVEDYIPGKEARFYNRDKFIASVTDPEFARAFFDIWLSEKTSAPAVRAKLLGSP